MINLGRGYPIASLAATLSSAAVFYRLWLSQGRPRGIAAAEAEAERDVADGE